MLNKGNLYGSHYPPHDAMATQKELGEAAAAHRCYVACPAHIHSGAEIRRHRLCACLLAIHRMPC